MRRTRPGTHLGEEQSRVKCEGPKSGMNMVCGRASKTPVAAAAWGGEEWGEHGDTRGARRKLGPLPGAWILFIVQQGRS